MCINVCKCVRCVEVKLSKWRAPASIELTTFECAAVRFFHSCVLALDSKRWRCGPGVFTFGRRFVLHFAFGFISSRARRVRSHPRNNFYFLLTIYRASALTRAGTKYYRVLHENRFEIVDRLLLNSLFRRSGL